MKTKSLLTLLCSALLITSCSEDMKQAAGEGALNLRLVADSQVVEMGTKADQDETLPDIGDFSLSLYKGEAIVNSWGKFEDYPQDMKYPVGAYRMVAYYGDVNSEGFDMPAFSGSEDFTIQDGNMTDVLVTSGLINTKISMSYTDAFKKYFSDYETSIVSSTGKTIAFAKDEIRAAYVKPGDVRVNMTMTTQTGASSTLEVAKLTDAQPKSHYRFKFDVNAGDATLLITFDSSTEEYPVTIDISDEALTAKAPVLTAVGFNDGDVLSVVQGAASENESLAAVLNAAAGVSGLTLTTQSEWLLSKGWPATIDFGQADAATIQLMKDLGLVVKGVGSQVVTENFAMVEFASLLPNLEPGATSSSHSFTISGKDKNNRITQSISFTVETVLPRLSVVSSENVYVGSNSVELDVEFDAQAERLSFEYMNESSNWQTAGSVEVLESNGENHRVRVSELPFGNTSKKIVAVYGSVRSNEFLVNVHTPVFTCAAEAVDVWAQKAYLDISAADEVLSIVQTYATLSVKKDNGSWVHHSDFQIEGNRIRVNGLSDNTAYSIRLTCVGDPQESDYTDPVTIHTEKALQVPNANMELWYSNKTDRNGNPITKNLKYVYWNKYFPWNSSDLTTKSWNTINQKTTQDGGTPSVFLFPTPPYVGCCYVANSGTIPTSESYEGSTAALIRSVGWGSGGTAEGDNSTVKKTDAGHLYLGEFNESTREPDFGIPFESRPSGVSFYYKYKPKNPVDHFVAKLVVLDANDNVIAENTLPASECGLQEEYVMKTISLEYLGENARKKAAKMYVSFVSGVELGINTTCFSYPPFGNLSDGQTLGSQLFIDDVKLLYN